MCRCVVLCFFKLVELLHLSWQILQENLPDALALAALFLVDSTHLAGCLALYLALIARLYIAHASESRALNLAARTLQAANRCVRRLS